MSYAPALGRESLNQPPFGQIKFQLKQSHKLTYLSETNKFVM
jgi:hypothetical protein